MMKYDIITLMAWGHILEEKTGKSYKECMNALKECESYVDAYEKLCNIE